MEVGAEGEGMVLGDTVNTASRLQSIAGPGTVLVDDVTRRVTEASIAYEDAGVHEVKGRDQPVRAWTALRVVAGVGGALRTAGLEAPFVGRDRELALVVESFETTVQERRARLVAAVGEAGTGKSRLLWEFLKYLDGIEKVVRWHHGRCLSYGEGVAYWALAEMVRTRARIEEEEDSSSARVKLRSAVEEFVPDERERRMVEPRLAHLLRLEERPGADRVDLFSGWRLFFERMAATGPVILAFEDLQWADSGLLDFIDYLLEWSAEFPIFVLTLGRPELCERRPGWQPMMLAPLDPQSLARMLDGLAPGLPGELVDRIVSRAEGIPLYAVETIRMLQDHGVLVQEGSRYVLTGDVSDLEVPETLHALVASRLDSLSPTERSLLQDAATLGQSFTAAATAALADLPEAEVVEVLDALVQKQILARDDDPRSPERGQYVFLQGLLRTVAYGTLSRRARKAKHVAAAQHLEQTWPGEQRDIAEVLASHYQEAIAAEPDADDVDVLRASARERLISAGQAAASLALGSEADHYLQAAAQLSNDDVERANLLEQSGRALWRSGEDELAERRLRDSIRLHQQSGESSRAAAAVTLATLLRLGGNLDEPQALLERFRANDDLESDRIERAQALAELATVLMFRGAIEEAGPLFDQALTTLEEEQAWGPLTDALVSHAIYLMRRHRLQQGAGTLKLAASLATERDLPAVALRARYNLASVHLHADDFVQAVDEVEDALILARERGDRIWERMLSQQSIAPRVVLGRWDEALEVAQEVRGTALDDILTATFLSQIYAARGDSAALSGCIALAQQAHNSTYVDARSSGATGLARPVLDDAPATAVEVVEEAYALCVESALVQTDEGLIDDLLAFVRALPPSSATPLLRAGRARLEAEQADRRGDRIAAEHSEQEAIALLRSVGARPLLARSLLAYGNRTGDVEAREEAREILVELGAIRWLERLDQMAEVTA